MFSEYLKNVLDVVTHVRSSANIMSSLGLLASSHCVDALSMVEDHVNLPGSVVVGRDRVGVAYSPSLSAHAPEYFAVARAWGVPSRSFAIGVLSCGMHGGTIIDDKTFNGRYEIVRTSDIVRECRLPSAVLRDVVGLERRLRHSGLSVDSSSICVLFDKRIGIFVGYPFLGYTPRLDEDSDFMDRLFFAAKRQRVDIFDDKISRRIVLEEH